MAIPHTTPSDLATFGDDFDLDVRTVEVADGGSLVNITGDNCGSTCGACTTGVH
jgi:FxLD family lantipeptide